MLSDLLHELGEELRERAGVSENLAPAGHDRNALLELARIVAHGSERKFAPLAAFIAGRYVQLRAGEADVSAAIEEALDVAGSLLEKRGEDG